MFVVGSIAHIDRVTTLFSVDASKMRDTGDLVTSLSGHVFVR